MKFQDVIFFTLFIVLLWMKKPKMLVYTGLGSLMLAIPLFALHIFFTAERLTWYAAAFFLSYILISLHKLHTVQ